MIRPPICDECALPVDEDDAAPTCGAHDVHAGCIDYFRCPTCREILRALEADEPVAVLDAQPGPYWSSEPCS